MRWLLGLLLLLLPSAAMTQGNPGSTGSVGTIPGSVWTYLGATYGAGWVLPPGSFFTSVTNNAALKAATGAAGSFVFRQGFYNPGDGGAAFYIYSTAPCSMNAGAGDDGAQVRAADGKCWLAQFFGDPDARIWGAQPTLANNTGFLQAAIDAQQGKSLLLAGGIYKFTTLSWSGALTLRSDSAQGGRTGGPGAGPGAQIACLTTGLRQLTANQAAEVTPGPGSVIDGLCIDHVGLAPTSGTAIALVGAGAKTVRNSQVNGACVAVDISWQDALDAASVNNAGWYVDRVDVLSPADAAGCAGFRVGHFSKNKPVGLQSPYTADARITNSNVWCSGGTANTIGMLVEEAGGLFVESNDIVACGWGTVIRPGQYQTVDGLNISNTVLGDSSTHNDLLIDTAHGTAVIQHVFINNSWMASALEDTVKIASTGGGAIAGIRFARANIYARANAPTGQRGLYVLAAAAGGGIKDISIDASTICAGAISSVDYLIQISASARFAIRDSTIGFCDRAAVEETVGGGILLDPAGGPYGVLTGNMFVGLTVAKTLVLNAGAAGALVVTNNIGLDDVVPTIGSATLMVPPVTPIVAISGTTPIQTIGQYWNGRQMMFTPASSGGTIPAFVAGGNVCNTMVPVANQVVILTFTPAFNCWWLK